MAKIETKTLYVRIQAVNHAFVVTLAEESEQKMTKVVDQCLTHLRLQGYKATPARIERS